MISQWINIKKCRNSMKSEFRKKERKVKVVLQAHLKSQVKVALWKKILKMTMRKTMKVKRVVLNLNLLLKRKRRECQRKMQL